MTARTGELRHRAHVRDDRLAGQAEVRLGIARAQRLGLLERHLGGHVARERIVRGRLVGHEVEVLAARRELRKDARRVREQSDRERSPLGCGAAHPVERVVERIRDLVQVARLEPPLDAARVDLDAEDRRTRHRRGERLRAAHPTEAGGEDRPAAEVRRAEVLLTCGRERLVRPLQDPLRPDVDPAPGGHLAEHRQPLRLEPAELVPGRPARHEERVRDEDTRRRLGRAEDGDRLAALDEERLVRAQPQERAHDVLQRLVASRRAPGPPVDHEPLRMLGDLRDRGC